MPAFILVTAMSASTRWSQLVRARAEAAHRGDRPPAGASWDGRATRFAKRFAGTAARDPLLDRVRPCLDVTTTLLDVGCGTGRFTLELAPAVAAVTAVDPSAAMLQHLRATADEKGITNVHCIQATWEEAEVDEADISICAHVLPFIEDADRFLEQLDRSSRKRVFVYMNALGSETPDPFWRRFHGQPLPPSPTYLDAADVLEELGIEPDVEIVELPRVVRHATIEDAIDEYREGLALEDSEQVRRELLLLLQDWLVRDANGWRSPFAALPAAILSWTPRRE